VFDVLVLAGRNMMCETLAARRELLSREVLPLLADPVREAPRFDAALADLIAAMRAQGLEGIVAKRLDSVYEPGGRSGAWRKMRINRAQEFVIGGYRRLHPLAAGSCGISSHRPPAKFATASSAGVPVALLR
jgi:bifunctional non-homologous end joining protein LigD